MIRRLTCALVLAALAACAHRPVAPLYDELGGQAGIEQVVADLLRGAGDDPRIAHHFIGVDLANLRRRLVEQICAESGGPCRYEGLSMQEAHDGLDIQEDEFAALVEHLVSALDAAGVAATARDQLVERLAAMRPDIVNR